MEESSRVSWSMEGRKESSEQVGEGEREMMTRLIAGKGNDAESHKPLGIGSGFPPTQAGVDPPQLRLSKLAAY